MDLANSIIFLIFKVYLQLLINLNLPISRCIQLSEFQIQNIFTQMPRHFKSHCSYSYIVVTLHLHIVKNGEFKAEQIIAF